MRGSKIDGKHKGLEIVHHVLSRFNASMAVFTLCSAEKRYHQIASALFCATHFLLSCSNMIVRTSSRFKAYNREASASAFATQHVHRSQTNCESCTKHMEVLVPMQGGPVKFHSSV